MNLLETSPADWLRNLLAGQPGVVEAAFDLPPNQQEILVRTAAGQEFTVAVYPARAWDLDREAEGESDG